MLAPPHAENDRMAAPGNIHLSPRPIVFRLIMDVALTAEALILSASFFLSVVPTVSRSYRRCARAPRLFLIGHSSSARRRRSAKPDCRESCGEMKALPWAARL